MVNFNHLHLFCMLFFIFFQSFHNLCFLIVSKDQIHSSIFFQFLCVSLCITTCSHHDRIRIHFFCFMKHLSGFTVCNVGDRTGIDLINICTFFKRNSFISCIFQKLLHRFYFVCIYFTAQIMKGNLFFHILPLIFSDSFILFLILIVFLYIQAKD